MRLTSACIVAGLFAVVSAVVDAIADQVPRYAKVVVAFEPVTGGALLNLHFEGRNDELKPVSLLFHAVCRVLESNKVGVREEGAHVRRVALT